MADRNDPRRNLADFREVNAAMQRMLSPNYGEHLGGLMRGDSDPDRKVSRDQLDPSLEMATSRLLEALQPLIVSATVSIPARTESQELPAPEPVPAAPPEEPDELPELAAEEQLLPQAAEDPLEQLPATEPVLPQVADDMPRTAEPAAELQWQPETPIGETFADSAAPLQSVPPREQRLEPPPLVIQQSLPEQDLGQSIQSVQPFVAPVPAAAAPEAAIPPVAAQPDSIPQIAPEQAVLPQQDDPFPADQQPVFEPVPIDPLTDFAQPIDVGSQPFWEDAGIPAEQPIQLQLSDPQFALPPLVVRQGTTEARFPEVQQAKQPAAAPQRPAPAPAPAQQPAQPPAPNQPLVAAAPPEPVEWPDIEQSVDTPVDAIPLTTPPDAVPAEAKPQSFAPWMRRSGENITERMHDDLLGVAPPPPPPAWDASFQIGVDQSSGNPLVIRDPGGKLVDRAKTAGEMANLENYTEMEDAINAVDFEIREWSTRITMSLIELRNHFKLLNDSLGSEGVDEKF